VSGEPDPKLLAAAASGALADEDLANSEAPAEAVADDLRALASVLRFCISGEPITSEPVRAAPSSDSATPVFMGVPAASSQPPAAAPESWEAQALPSGLFAEPANLGDPDPTTASAINDTTHEAAPGAWFATTPVPISPAVTKSPLIPERWHIPLWVVLIALAGVAVLAWMSYVMGAWNRMPPIDFDRSLQTAPASASASAAPDTAPAPAPLQPARRSRIEPDKNTAVPVAPAASAADDVTNTTPLLSAPRDAPAAGVPASAKATPKKVPPQTASKQPIRKPQRAVAAKVATPLAACGARTNFALERCMQLQCQNKKWASHPQCTSRRAG
jgi:hypothetical protein